MTQPLALLVYEILIPGSQLVNRLREMGYRVMAVTTPADLPAVAQQEQPMVILADLVARSVRVPDLIRRLRADPVTAHVPVLAYGPVQEEALQEEARKAGATLVAASDGLLEQLPELLQQVLELE